MLPERYRRGNNQKDFQNLRVAKTPTTKTISRIAVFISVTCLCRSRAYTGVGYSRHLVFYLCHARLPRNRNALLVLSLNLSGRVILYYAALETLPRVNKNFDYFYNEQYTYW